MEFFYQLYFYEQANEVICANIFFQVSKYTAVYFVKVLFSSKSKPP